MDEDAICGLGRMGLSDNLSRRDRRGKSTTEGGRESIPTESAMLVVCAVELELLGGIGRGDIAYHVDPSSSVREARCRASSGLSSPSPLSGQGQFGERSTNNNKEKGKKRKGYIEPRRARDEHGGNGVNNSGAMRAASFRCCSRRTECVVLAYRRPDEPRVV